MSPLSVLSLPENETAPKLALLSQGHLLAQMTYFKCNWIDALSSGRGGGRIEFDTFTSLQKQSSEGMGGCEKKAQGLLFRWKVSRQNRAISLLAATFPFP